MEAYRIIGYRRRKMKPIIAQAEMVNKLNIGGMKYTVYLNDGLEAFGGGEAFGSIDHNEMKIWVDYNIPPDRLLITIIHEALHIMFEVKELSRYVVEGADPDGVPFKERLVTLLAIEMFSLFNDATFIREMKTLAVECKGRKVLNAE
jgi:hypothetical protein